MRNRNAIVFAVALAAILLIATSVSAQTPNLFEVSSTVSSVESFTKGFVETDEAIVDRQTVRVNRRAFEAARVSEFRELDIEIFGFPYRAENVRLAPMRSRIGAEVDRYAFEIDGKTSYVVVSGGVYHGTIRTNHLDYKLSVGERYGEHSMTLYEPEEITCDVEVHADLSKNAHGALHQFVGDVQKLGANADTEISFMVAVTQPYEDSRGGWNPTLAAVAGEFSVVEGAFAELGRVVKLVGVKTYPQLVETGQFGDILTQSRADEELQNDRAQWRADLVTILGTPGASVNSSAVSAGEFFGPEAGYHILIDKNANFSYSWSHEVGHNANLAHEHGACMAPEYRTIMRLPSGCNVQRLQTWSDISKELIVEGLNEIANYLQSVTSTVTHGATTFEIDSYFTVAGQEGRGVEQAQLGSDSRAIWFFSPGNTELVVKVLDACGINGHYWISIAGMTDVATRTTVRNPNTNEEWTWTTQAGTFFKGTLDTQALACE